MTSEAACAARGFCYARASKLQAHYNIEFTGALTCRPDRQARNLLPKLAHTHTHTHTTSSLAARLAVRELGPSTKSANLSLAAYDAQLVVQWEAVAVESDAPSPATAVFLLGLTDA